ncbi:MAG: homoserine O-acetyltransferase [Spirochaetaceae bacterium]|nr:MAG: homoserine O-acetyltransferase [Spirochaetaceae bacterium]
MTERNTHSVGIVKTLKLTFAENGDPLLLENSQKISPVTVAYETYGELSDTRDNAILIVHALSGDAHVAGYHSESDRKPGWWDIMVGPGKPVDTNRYFVICSNVLGGCQGTTGPSSNDSATRKPYGVRFPVVTIGDMVEVQKRLLDSLGINRLHSVMGGSMGGMQVLEWVMKYPDIPKSAIVIASCAALSAQAIAFDAVGRSAITSDPAWNAGDYYDTDSRIPGLAVARMLGHITYLSEAGMRDRFGRKLKESGDYAYEFRDEFEIETYLAYKGSSFLDRFDANTYLYVTKAMDYFDAGAKYGNGSLVEAFRNVKAKMFFVSFTSDWLFPSRQSVEMVRSAEQAGKRVSYLNIDTPYGHDSFLLPCDRLFSGVQSFLSHVDME